MIDRIRWHFRAWRYRLKVDPHEIRWVLTHLRPGQTAVDVGAHKGGYTYWMRRCVGPAGRVFAFEPQPALCARLQKLVQDAGLSNVTVERFGLSVRAGTLTLSVPGGRDSPSASFEPTEDSAGAEFKVTVGVTTLDAYFPADGANKRVDFIKCDAEGHELAVFQGAERLLLRDRPDLMFECERRHLGNRSPLEVFGYLESLGYRGQAFGHSGLMDLDAFDLAIHQAEPGSPSYVNNFLFTAQTPGAPR